MKSNLFTSLLAGSLIFANSCSFQAEKKVMTVRDCCTEKPVECSSIDTLASSNAGIYLLRIDGRYAVGDSSCMTFSGEGSQLSVDLKSRFILSQSQGNFNYVWDNGEFYKEHFSEGSFRK